MSAADQYGKVELCVGRVMHARSRPLQNRFAYPVFFLRLQLQTAAGKPVVSAAKAAPWFGLERPGLASFYAKDHADRSGGRLLDWLAATLQRAGLALPDGEVYLQCFSRVLGYVFNPVSFWFCHDADGALRVLVAEVNNTFGESHQYVLVAADGGAISKDSVLVCRKAFHVSPFCEIRGEYRFRVVEKGHLHGVVIDYFDDPVCAEPLLRTAVWGRGADLTAPHMARTLAGMPLFTFGVVARIHWQALKLWLGRVPFIPKPKPPTIDLTHNLESTR